jgi:cytidylate kinase
VQEAGVGVVTISAAYGAGGSEIGPAVARELDLEFVDRAITAAVAAKLGISEQDARARDEKVDTGLWRVISSMSLLPDQACAGSSARTAFGDERTFKDKTEQVLREIAAGPGGVVLGRAAALVLADEPRALHVRLDAVPADRVAALCRWTGVSRRDAERDLRHNDSAREAYVRHFYRTDATDPRHYHLVIDSTRLEWEVVTDLIVRAARSRGVTSALQFGD